MREPQLFTERHRQDAKPFFHFLFSRLILSRGWKNFLANATMLDGASGNSERLRMLRGAFDICSDVVAASGRRHTCLSTRVDT